MPTLGNPGLTPRRYSVCGTRLLGLFESLLNQGGTCGDDRLPRHDSLDCHATVSRVVAEILTILGRISYPQVHLGQSHCGRGAACMMNGSTMVPEAPVKEEKEPRKKVSGSRDETQIELTPTTHISLFSSSVILCHLRFSLTII